MSLKIDVSRPFRSPQALASLVGGVVLSASKNDESDWIEWKSDLDLSLKDTQGTIGR